MSKHIEDRSEIDERIAALLRRKSDVDASTMAAYVEGSLPASKRIKLERRLAADPEAQLLLREIHAKRMPIARGAKIPVLGVVAATVLVATGVFFWTQRGSAQAADFDTRIARVVASLRASPVDSMRGFSLATDDELSSDSVMRGGGQWMNPRGSLLEAPRQLRWKLPEGATECAVELRGPNVHWQRMHSGESMKAPTLAPGRYTVSMRATDGLARQVVRAQFVVLDADAAQATKDVLTHIARESGDAAVSDVIAAHYLYRNRFYVAAGEAAERACTRGEDAKRRVSALRRHLDASGIR